MQISGLGVSAKRGSRSTNLPVIGSPLGGTALPENIRFMVKLAKKNGISIEVIPLSLGDQDHGPDHVQALGLPEGVLRDMAGSLSGISLYGGFVRLLGAGGQRHCYESIASYSEQVFGLSDDGSLKCGLVIATDALGGIFAINNGTIPFLEKDVDASQRDAAIGQVCYYCPEGLQWDNLKLTYLNFLLWCTTKRWTAFYSPLLWLGWEGDVAALTCDDALRTEPMLYKKLGPKEKGRKKSKVPSAELASELLLLGEKVWERPAKKESTEGTPTDSPLGPDKFVPSPRGGVIPPKGGLSSQGSLGSYADSEDLEELAQSARSGRSRRASAIMTPK